MLPRNPLETFMPGDNSIAKDFRVQLVQGPFDPANYTIEEVARLAHKFFFEDHYHARDGPFTDIAQATSHRTDGKAPIQIEELIGVIINIYHASGSTQRGSTISGKNQAIVNSNCNANRHRTCTPALTWTESSG